MKKSMTITALAALCGAILFTGCDGGDSANGGTVGPDLNGDWSGRYYLTDGSVDVGLKASIIVNTRDFFLETSLPDAGHILTGTLHGDGNIFATDAFDAEAWTTHEGPASASYVKLMDFLYPGSATFRVIELRR